MKFFEVLTMIGAAIGFLVLLSVLSNGSAVQQAAGAAIATALVAIPYCIASTLQRRAIMKGRSSGA